MWLWLSPGDKMATLFRNTNPLFRDGVVVWGHVIQANQLMFQPGSENCPGEVVYSLAESHQVDPDTLAQVARDLFSLKGTHPNHPELNPIANYLTDEMIRVFGLPVPKVISPTLPCQISTTMFFRKHLPRQRLCSSLLPLVVNPSPPFVALPLPERYWPPELLAWWTQG